MVTSARTPRPKQRRQGAADAPLGERDIQALQTLLDAVPAPLEPLDVSAVDGFLGGVLPWAAGFSAALETFPALLGSDDDALVAPLALVYRHLGTETLEDADALVDEIDTLEPPADLAEAVEQLVRAT